MNEKYTNEKPWVKIIRMKSIRMAKSVWIKIIQIKSIQMKKSKRMKNIRIAKSVRIKIIQMKSIEMKKSKRMKSIPMKSMRVENSITWKQRWKMSREEKKRKVENRKVVLSDSKCMWWNAN